MDGHFTDYTKSQLVDKTYFNYYNYVQLKADETCFMSQESVSTYNYIITTLILIISYDN